MCRKRIFSKHFDLSHAIMYDECPATYTKSIGVPGKFVKKINRRVHLKDGTGGEMDSAYIANPDYKWLFERVAVALEHQSIPVDDKKLIKFGDYDIQLVVDEHLPTLLVVASHLNPEKSKNRLIRSPSDISQIYFLDLGEDNISQRLSTVSRIIYNNQYLSQEMALNLGIIALYAPRYRAYDIMGDVVNLYLQIVENLDFKMEYVLYSVLTVLIDAYFDDEDEYWRLINMMNEITSAETQMKFASHERTLESLTRAEEKLADTTEKLASANEELASANEELASANEELASANEELASANEDLVNANNKIVELEAEVKRLTDELNGK